MRSSPPVSSSPPVPLSLRERGDERWAPESPPHHLFDVLPCDVAVLDADHAVPCRFERSRAGHVVAPPTVRLVHVSFQLDHEVLRSALEVDDEAVQDLLAAELETEHRAVS